MIKKLTWFLFLFIAWIVLILNGNKNKKLHLNFYRELKELCKKRSKYNEDSDFILMHKDKKL